MAHPDIATWIEDECLADDESCQMAGEMLEDLWGLQNREDYQEDFKEGEFFPPGVKVQIIECDGQDVGYVKTKPGFPDMDGRHGIYMDELFVHPDFRAKGVGKWAIDETFKDQNIDFIAGNSLDQATTFWEERGAILSPIVMMGKRGVMLYRENLK